MTRRSAVLSAILAYVRRTQGDNLHFRIGGESRSTVLAIEIDAPPQTDLFYIRWRDREAVVSLEEAMDALGARKVKR